MVLEQSQLFRAANERIHRVPRRWPGPVDYVCECEDPECRVMLKLEPREFAEIAAAPGCYMVAREHYRADWEIIRQRPAYLVVQVPATVGSR